MKKPPKLWLKAPKNAPISSKGFPLVYEDVVGPGGEPPICCNNTPQPIEPEPEAVRQCGSCGSTWWP